MPRHGCRRLGRSSDWQYSRRHARVCGPAGHRQHLFVSMSHVVGFTMSTLAEQTTPAALALTDDSRSVSAVSLGDLDLDANYVGDGVSWTPPEKDAGIDTYETCLATDAAGSSGALTGSMAVGTNMCAVVSDTGSAGESHFAVHAESALAEQATPVALAPADCPAAPGGLLRSAGGRLRDAGGLLRGAGGLLRGGLLRTGGASGSGAGGLLRGAGGLLRGAGGLLPADCSAAPADCSEQATPVALAPAGCSAAPADWYSGAGRPAVGRLQSPGAGRPPRLRPPRGSLVVRPPSPGGTRRVQFMPLSRSPGPRTPVRLRPREDSPHPEALRRGAALRPRGAPGAERRGDDVESCPAQ